MGIFKEVFWLLFFGGIFFSCMFSMQRVEVFWVLIFLRVRGISLLYISFLNFRSLSLFSVFRQNILAICFDVVFSFLILSIFWRVRGRYFFGCALFFAALIEIGRTPFDLVERESELVSGYNIEFRRLRFTFLFLGEYLGLVFFSCFLLSYFAFLGLPSTRHFLDVMLRIYFLVLIRA